MNGLDLVLFGTKAAKAIKIVRERLPSSRKDLDAAWDVIIEETALEASAMIKKLAADLDDIVIEKIVQRADQREIQSFFRVIFDAAVHSVVKERMRMLCSALAGGLFNDFESEMRSRMTRAVL